MKITVLQPPYPCDPTLEAAQCCLDWMMQKLEELKPDHQDLVVLPEYANAPGLNELTPLRQFAKKQGEIFLEHIAGFAKRLKCIIVVGAIIQDQSRWWNRTLLFDRKGYVSCVYDKVHLTAAETDQLELTPGNHIPVFEHEGLRFGFATCFDLYFAEHFSVLADQQADIIICPSYQRSETAERIRLIAQTRAMDSGAYLVRSSYAMKEPGRGGRSLVSSPWGSLLADAGSTPSVIYVEIQAEKKFVKPMSHGQSPIEHRSLIESQRRSQLYRPYSTKQQQIRKFPFPHLCAHRGLSAVCPENTLPAFSAALSLGVHEIELDLRMSQDGVAVVCHDADVDRTTDGSGLVAEMDWQDIAKLDVGSQFGQNWRGVTMPRFEQVIDCINGRAAINVHIKDDRPDGRLVRLVCDLIRENGLAHLAYIAGQSESILATAQDYAPDIARACLMGQADPSSQIQLAEQFNCARIQFARLVTQSDIQSAHEAGLICQLFWSDDSDEAMTYVRKGIDIILTNISHRLISNFVAAQQLTSTDELSNTPPEGVPVDWAVGSGF